INMNGRTYDSVMGWMLSVDNYVPDGFDSQDYYRYTYARNNPLSYTDPDGEFWHLVIGGGIGGVLNLGVQAALGNVHTFKDGLFAFGHGFLKGGMAAIRSEERRVGKECRYGGSRSQQKKRGFETIA